MKYIFIFILSATFLFSKGQDSCYSVQLESFFNSNKSVDTFDSLEYPESCRRISFGNINTIRCGCFNRYSAAKKEAKRFIKKYPKSMIVTTYKYRFKTKKPMPIVEKIFLLADPMVAPSITEATLKQIKPDDYVVIKKDSFEFMKDIVMQGSVDVTSQYYMAAPKDKLPNNLSASANLEAGYNKENIKAKTKIKIQQDYYDLEGKSKKTNRSFIRLDELYGEYDFEDSKISFGKNIRFWGSLEVRNITDGFNPDELRGDPFYKDKLGVWNTSYSYYTEDGEFSAIVKLYEQERQMSGNPYAYYYFPSTINAGVSLAPLKYSDKLDAQDGQTRPSVYLKYSASTDTEYPLDYAVIFENGYDSQRYYTTDFNAASNSATTSENAYLVNKLSTYNTMVVESTLCKLEAVYADVINDQEISDYMHIGLGVEHTLSQFHKEGDLGLIVEYYNYISFDTSKRNDLELFELFQNDLFIGGRYSFNEGENANLIAGAIVDLEYAERVYYIEYETRIADIIKVNFDYRYIDPSKDDKTAFNLMGAHERMSLKLAYHF